MNEHRPGTIRTFTGLYIDPWEPDFSVVRIKDIAHGLANQCRFNGHSRFFYSVAEHSVIVSKLVPPELALWGLLHDAPEYILGDCVTPIKAKLPDFQDLEDQWMVQISSRYIADDKYWNVVPGEVKAADAEALAIELHHLLGHGPKPETPHGLLPRSLEPHKAEHEFLQRFMELI